MTEAKDEIVISREILDPDQLKACYRISIEFEDGTSAEGAVIATAPMHITCKFPSLGISKKIMIYKDEGFCIGLQKCIDNGVFIVEWPKVRVFATPS